MHFRKFAASLFTAALCCASSSAFAQVRVTWPDGWENIARPISAKEADGTTSKGFQQIAIKKGKNEVPDGMIFIIHMWREGEAPQMDLNTEAQKLKRMQYTQASKPGNKTECGEYSKTTIGGVPALSMNCNTLEKGVEFRQDVSVFLKGKDFVTLIYTAPKDLYDANKPAFNAVASSLTF